jgi:hypothetical protein
MIIIYILIYLLVTFIINNIRKYLLKQQFKDFNKSDLILLIAPAVFWIILGLNFHLDKSMRNLSYEFYIMAFFVSIFKGLIGVIWNKDISLRNAILISLFVGVLVFFITPRI